MQPTSADLRPRRRDVAAQEVDAHVHVRLQRGPHTPGHLWVLTAATTIVVNTIVLAHGKPAAEPRWPCAGDSTRARGQDGLMLAVRKTVPGVGDLVLEAGLVVLDPIVTDVLPLRDWRTGVEHMERREGLKTVFDPRRD